MSQPDPQNSSGDQVAIPEFLPVLPLKDVVLFPFLYASYSFLFVPTENTPLKLSMLCKVLEKLD